MVFQLFVAVTLEIQFPSSPSSHGSHLSPAGIVKFNTAALLVPLFVTLASVHGSHVVVVQISIVALSPSSQSSQSSHGSHFAHAGITNFKTASELEPTFSTLADVQAAHVTVLHTVIVAASHWSH